MAHKIKAAYVSNLETLENTFDILETEYSTEEGALTFIKNNLSLNPLAEGQTQVVLEIGEKKYIYFEIIIG